MQSLNPHRLPSLLIPQLYFYTASCCSKGVSETHSQSANGGWKLGASYTFWTILLRQQELSVAQQKWPGQVCHVIPLELATPGPPPRPESSGFLKPPRPFSLVDSNATTRLCPSAVVLNIHGPSHAYELVLG